MNYTRESTMKISVPEEIVKEAAAVVKMTEPDSNNSFQKVLNAGEAFKEAGLEPIYLLNQEDMSIQVITKETFDIKKLH
ncbi:hypothetical protein UFOVP787_50 [uncultured Caudovirales phage]|uniref:Uncharacterized protein n=1 Tax=uncultured Caudovirales phage TaxID=2100421 RepID=A0A6J5NXV2_9CAUD|nr:hypothetical protein UFOVP787_50 [uncultured Caudovirales phage]